MKKLIFIGLMATTLMSCRFGSSSTSIKVGHNQYGFLFEAKFPEDKMDKATAYFSEKLAADLFEDIEQERAVNLGDSLKFNLESSEGEIKIKFNRNENSRNGYNKLMAVCKGFGKAIE